MNGAWTLTINKFLLNMIDSFNAENDVIKIIPDITVDATEYLTRRKKQIEICKQEDGPLIMQTRILIYIPFP